MRFSFLAQALFNRPLAIRVEKAEIIVAALAERVGIMRVVLPDGRLRAFDDDGVGVSIGGMETVTSSTSSRVMTSLPASRQKEDAGNHVAHQALRAKTDGDAYHPEPREERADVEAERRQCDDRCDGRQPDQDHVASPCSRPQSRWA